MKKILDRDGTVDVLQLARDDWDAPESVFHPEDNSMVNESHTNELKIQSPTEKLVNGDVQIIFGHPDVLLSKEG